MRESAKSWLRLNYEDPARKVRSLENDERTTFRVSGEPSRLLGDAEWQCGKPLKWKATSHSCRVTLYTRIRKNQPTKSALPIFAESSWKKDIKFLNVFYDFMIYYRKSSLLIDQSADKKSGDIRKSYNNGDKIRIARKIVRDDV